MSVNIWVTDVDGGSIRSICWGTGLSIGEGNDGSTLIEAVGEKTGFYEIRETPAEIMALVKAAQREQQRREIAGNCFRALAEFVACRPTKHPELDMAKLADIAIEGADALLAALDAREGE